ncbi:MAG: ABC transporter ATP-binding protein [Myxococcales bacterium]|nr:ABC transporter ATP-binding protein [Myxococcales bacterium]
MAESAVRTESVRVTLGARRVLRDISFQAQYGAITAVLGPNGAGKTTLLKAVAGLLPYEGRIEVAGEDLRRLHRSDRVRLLAYVPQVSLLASPFRVEHVVQQARYSLGTDKHSHHAAVEHAMEVVDVAHLRKRSFTQLSGGERRRVLLARALATEARLILLDEPTASLDIRHALSFYELLRELAASGYCIVAVLHRLDDAARFTDRATLLKDGRLTHQGVTADVISAEPIRDVYGVETSKETVLSFRLRG